MILMESPKHEIITRTRSYLIKINFKQFCNSSYIISYVSVIINRWEIRGAETTRKTRTYRIAQTYNNIII